MFPYKIQVTCTTHDFSYSDTTYITVMADNDNEAVIIAAQMAHTTFPFDGMPIETIMLNFPT